MIYFKDASSRFIRVNDAMIRWFGAKDLAEVVGKTDADFFSEEHARQAFADEQRILETGEPLRGYVEKETWPDGHETWASTTKLPMRDAKGKIIGTFGLSRDITERRQAEEQLARYAEELRRRNQELEEDLDMARELQGALMPRHYPYFANPANAQGVSALRFSHVFQSIELLGERRFFRYPPALGLVGWDFHLRRDGTRRARGAGRGDRARAGR